MTIEIRGMIEPKDIVAVEYECPSCHARSVRRLEPERRADVVPTGCGNCSAAYFRGGSREATDQLEAFLSFLIHYKKADFPFALRFEVAGLGDAASEAGRRPPSC